MGLNNRPYKFGPRDRHEFITYNSETAILCENDVNGNPLYIGRAKAGSATNEPFWQISFHAYDVNSSLVSKKWPQNDAGVPSTDYEFSWNDRASYTYA